jgi:hypothetical protein
MCLIKFFLICDSLAPPIGTVQCRLVGQVNNKLERVWNGAIVTHFMALFLKLPGGIVENRDNLPSE